MYPFPHAVPLRKEFSSPDECMDENIPMEHGPTLLRGSLQTRDGHPVSGAVVDVPSLSQVPAYTTGPAGGWVLIFPEALNTGPVDLRFRLLQPDGSIVDHDVPDVCVVRGYECSLSQAALRGWATDRGRPVSRFTLQSVSTGSGGPYPDLAVTSTDGGWFYYFDVDEPLKEDVVDVTARLPDGRNLVEHDVLVRPRATVAVPAFRFQ